MSAAILSKPPEICKLLTKFFLSGIIARQRHGIEDAITSPRVKIRKRAGRFRLLAGLIAALALAGCGRGPRPENFVLVTLDTQRADFVSAYDPGGASTPGIDSLARDGVLFKNAFSLIPITMPAHASIFFSEPPHEIKNYNNGQKVAVKRSRPSLANLFRKSGFATAAFVSLGVLASEYGLNQGFETYQGDFPADRWYLSAGEVNQSVLPWLEKNKERPFFLWVHYSDPHDPYATPDAPNDLTLRLNGTPVCTTSLQKYTLNEVALNLRPGKNELRVVFRNEFDANPDHFLGRLDLVEFSPPLKKGILEADFRHGWFIRRPDEVYFFKGESSVDIDNPGGLKQVRLTFRGKPVLSVAAARTSYRREVEYMDGEVGRLWEKLRELGLYDKTAVVLVGDHGEGLGEYHNDFGDPHVGHVHYLYGVYMKVPLIIKRGIPAEKGTVRDEVATLLDVAPTIAGIMGLRPPGSFRGWDLFRPKQKPDSSFFEETYRPESVRDRFGLLAFPWHVIFTPEDKKLELYDLARDPKETANLSPTEGSGAVAAALRLRLEEFARLVLSGKEDIRVDDRTKEMLRALGYIR
jgi:arylsulfatase A-like enzyme